MSEEGFVREEKNFARIGIIFGIVSFVATPLSVYGVLIAVFSGSNAAILLSAAIFSVMPVLAIVFGVIALIKRKSADVAVVAIILGVFILLFANRIFFSLVLDILQDNLPDWALWPFVAS